MYLSRLRIENFRAFGEGKEGFEVELHPGVTALIGRNDSGKSAVIDAIRYVLLTRDQEYIPVLEDDLHVDEDGNTASEISICCTFSSLTDAETVSYTHLTLPTN